MYLKIISFLSTVQDYMTSPAEVRSGHGFGTGLADVA